MVSYALHVFYKAFFYAVFGAYIMYVVALAQKLGKSAIFGVTWPALPPPVNTIVLVMLSPFGKKYCFNT